jgi:hypothetical protein
MILLWLFRWWLDRFVQRVVHRLIPDLDMMREAIDR